MVANAVISDWPSGSANTGWPSEPSGMLLPGRVEGWPAGTQRAANGAQRLLSQAVAWWDASSYRDGDRFLRNLGTGGELLDLRLGSSIVANSNDPRYLAPEESGYVYLPGVFGNRLSVPDENALDITGDIDIRVQVAADSWAVGGQGQGLIEKWFTTGDQRSWGFGLNATGAPRLTWTTAGTAASVLQASTQSVSFNAGDVKWLRVTLDVDNGASGHDVKFFTSDDGVAWTQLGNTITNAGTTSVFASTAAVWVGAYFTDTYRTVGRFYAAQIWDGIEENGGTKVLDIDCDAITSGSATSFTAVTNQTVTISRSTSGRVSVAVPGRRRNNETFLLGTDDNLEIPVENVWQHGLLNFAQGDSATIGFTIRQWNTPISTGRYLSKYDSAGGAGWSVQSTTTTHGVTATLTDGTTTGSPASAASSAGALRTFHVVIDRAAQTATSYLDGVAGTPVALGTVGNLANLLPFRIGRQSGGSTTYQNFQFYQAAIWRRRLSRAEMLTHATYMSERIA